MRSGGSTWVNDGGGIEPPIEPERNVPALTFDAVIDPPYGRGWAPLAAPLVTVTDCVAAGCDSCALANSKAIWTTRVVPAESAVKCHCKTDCNAALRSSSGPLSTRASATVPFASSLTSTDKVP